MNSLIEEIGNADATQISDLVEAITVRYNALFPIIWVTLEKSQDRNTQLNRIIQILNGIKQCPRE